MKIILVEDDPKFGKLIKDYLITESQTFNLVNTGINLHQKLEEESYDILILDVMLPEKNGIDICRELRRKNIEIPILFITALNNQMDKIKAFESGADDYLIKPFDFQELLARIKALVRREKKIKPNTNLTWGNLVMMLEEKKVTYEDKYLHLTPTEYKILEIFLTTPQKVFNIDDIIDKLWDIDTLPTYNTLRTHIKSLRKKLTNIGLTKDFIDTVYGMGYRLKPLDNKTSKENNNKNLSLSINDLSPNSQDNNQNQLQLNKDEKLQLLIKEMWLENKESISEDCDKLLNYIQGKNDLSMDKAISIAHNFVGFLGSIGYAESSDISRKIETILKENYHNIKEEKNILKITNLIHQLEKSLFPEGKPKYQKQKQKLFSKEKIEILVIDENQKLANNLIMFIENPQVSLNFSHTITSAINYLKEKTFDVVILETQWENLCDRENTILNLLTTEKKDTKIIIYTKDDTLENRLYCSKYPISAFLSKNNSLEILWENIESALNQNNSNAIVNPLYNILIIDDDVRFTKLLKQKLIISELPLNVNTICDSETFLDEIKKIKPQLIILDLQMPKINGLDICRIIKKDPLLQSIPVIFLTSNLDSEIIEQFLEAGADDFISKSKIDLELYPRILTHLQRSNRLDK